MIPDYPGNSKAPQAPPPQREDVKKIEPVVTGEVAARKKGLGKRFAELFIGGDSKSVLQYVVAEVLIPQVKDMLTEGVSSGFERWVYGESSRRPQRFGSRPSGGARPVNYALASRGNNPIGRATREERQPTASLKSHGIEDILLATRVEADTVLDHMYSLLQKYEMVSVSDLYSLINWSSTHIDHKWGWVDLQGANVRLTREGYVLNLPKPQPLD
jgi:hypothetical protein